MGIKQVFIAKIEELRPMLQWIELTLTKMEFDQKTLRKIELASEESLVNIIRHAYKEKPETIEIDIRAFPKSHVEISIKDTGPPFNPLEINAIDPNLSIDERQPGGLGIHFIKNNMDEVRYKREQDTNVLVLIKKVVAKID